MAKEAQILFEFENSGNKLIHDRPINYSDHYSDRYFNISMIQEIIDGVITNEADTYHLRSTYIKDIEFIWQKDISNYCNVYKHLKIYGDNSNFKIKYSSDDTNPLELPISNNEEFYLYKLGDPITLNVKCQDLWYKITVTDQNTLTYTTSDSSDFNLLPSPEKNNIVYKDDLDRYTYSKIKVGDNLKGKRLGLRNDEIAVNKFLYNIAKDNYMHPIIRGKDGSNIAYENKTENSYMGFYIKYANNTSTYYSKGTVSFIGSGYRPSGQTIIKCTEDFIVTSISAGWDDILRIIDEVPLLSTKEDKSNKVTSILSNPTVDQYPTARAVVDYVNEKVVQSDYNQNDPVSLDYIKNRPCYEDEPTTMTLFSLSNPTLTTWQVLQSFESRSDQIDYMVNLFSLIPSLSLDGRKLDLMQTTHQISEGELSEINFPSDSYNAILDYTIGYFYQDTLNNFFIGIVLVPSTDTNNDAKLMYYVFTSGTIPDNVTIKNLAFTFTGKNIKMMEDKYLYSIVDTSDDLNLYASIYQKKFTKRNNISDLTTQPTITPKPSIVATDTGELYLVSFDWENKSEPI